MKTIRGNKASLKGIHIEVADENCPLMPNPYLKLLYSLSKYTTVQGLSDFLCVRRVKVIPHLS